MAEEKDYDALITHIQEHEHTAQQAGQRQRSLEHELEQQRKLAAKRLLQLKTMQTLSLGIFSTLQAEEIYHLTCQTVVHQLLWDSAFVIDFQDQQGMVLGSYQATQKQLQHVGEYLGQNKYFREAYAQRIALSTYTTRDTAALALCSLFQTDEVVAMPIQFGEQMYGYLVACSHTNRAERR